MLVDDIQKDYVAAMKARDAVRVSTLSFLRSQLKYAMIEKKTERLEDADALEVIKKQVKQRRDSIEQFTKGGRPELAEKEQKELAVLQSYLPQGLSADQIKKIIGEVIQETGASGMKDMGGVMKGVFARLAGEEADKQLVSALVKESLTAL